MSIYPESIGRIREGGFTLIEVMVAISILTIGLLAIASMQTSAIQGNSFATKVTEGTTLAQDRMEELLSLSYNDALLDPDGSPHGETQAQMDAHPGYTITWNVTEVDVDGDTVDDSKQITVTCTWTDRGRQKQSVLTCVRTQL